MTIFIRAFTFVAVLLLTACASTPSGPDFSQRSAVNNEKALVYLYRPSVYYGKAVTYPILLDEEKIADMGNNSFLVTEMEPGLRSIRTDTPSIDDALDVNLEAGQTVYLRLTTGKQPAICFCTRLTFEVVDSDTALDEIAVTKQETDRVYIPQI